jgi:murein DD-endopeptidase MepM/ murein hydrolase activator NlpD
MPGPGGAPVPLPPPRPANLTPRSGAAAPSHVPVPAPRPPHLDPPASPSVSGGSGQRVFPLFIEPLCSYKTGARWFGAPRSGGRHHAAVDLIAPHLTPIRAIADGTIVQPAYYFYTGTNALEVFHPGIGVVRYGEIDVHKVVRWKAKDPVHAGQIIAYVGRLDSGSSMLHFELYSGRGHGALTVRGNPPYQRRSDLVNPTSFMDGLLPQVKGHH